MAAIFADAVVFGYKALSKESSPSSYNEQSVPLAAEASDYWRPQVQNPELELTHASGSSKQAWHITEAVFTVFELLMMGGETA